MHETDIFQSENCLEKQDSYGTKLEIATLRIGNIKTKDSSDLRCRDKLIKRFPSSSSFIELLSGGVLNEISK